MTEAESLLKTSDDAKINWEANACDITEALEEMEKAESEEDGRMLTMIIQQHSTIMFSNSFKSCYLPVFNVLMKKDFMDKVEDLSKVESKLEKEFAEQHQRAT